LLALGLRQRTQAVRSVRVLLLQNLIYVPSHGGANKCNRLLLEALAALLRM
jgi:hypothetical protein